MPDASSASLSFSGGWSRYFGDIFLERLDTVVSVTGRHLETRLRMWRCCYELVAAHGKTHSVCWQSMNCHQGSDSRCQKLAAIRHGNVLRLPHCTSSLLRNTTA